MDYKRVIGVGLVVSLFISLGIFGLSQEFPPDFDLPLPDQPGFPGAEGDGPKPDAPPPDSFPDAPVFPDGEGVPPVRADDRPLPDARPAFPGARAPSPARAALPGDISGPAGVPDQCVNLYDIWAMGPQIGVCELPAGSPLDTDGDGCFTEPDVQKIMEKVNVRCS